MQSHLSATRTLEYNEPGQSGIDAGLTLFGIIIGLTGGFVAVVQDYGFNDTGYRDLERLTSWAVKAYLGLSIVTMILLGLLILFYRKRMHGDLLVVLPYYDRSTRVFLKAALGASISIVSVMSYLGGNFLLPGQERSFLAYSIVSAPTSTWKSSGQRKITVEAKWKPAGIRAKDVTLTANLHTPVRDQWYIKSIEVERNGEKYEQPRGRVLPQHKGDLFYIEFESGSSASFCV